MKNLAFALLLLQSTQLFAAKPKPRPNPADYPLTMQVNCSFVTGTIVHLGGTLDGKTIELTIGDATLPYVPGPYKMRLFADHNPDTFELNQTYEIYLPDGTVRTLFLSGIGRDVCAARAS